MKINSTSHPRLYNIWRKMKQRCSDPSVNNYQWYGGKGVTVCQEWEESFTAFAEWALNNGYEEHLTIDRRDSDKNYNPNNCQWLTRSENTRRAQVGRTGKRGGNAIKVEFEGREQTIEEWADEVGVEYITLYTRLRSPNWTVEEALTTPADGRTNGELVTFQGVTQTLSEWAKEIGISHDALYQRLHRLNWSVEKALTYIARTRKPSNPKEAKDRVITFNGKTQNVADWAKELDMPYYTLYQRLYKLDWSEEKALTKAVRQKRSS